MDLVRKIIHAETAIRPYLIETPLMYSPVLSEITGANVYLKCEHVQITHSFKVRGALQKILTIKETNPDAMVITASSGNHALGVSYALRITQMKGLIYLPENVSGSKLTKLKKWEVPHVFQGAHCGETEIFARAQAQQVNGIYVSPYNDPEVVAGQGTIAVELFKQLPDVDVVYVAVGGGGLVSGIGAYLKAIKPDVRIVGCLPQNAPGMYACIRAGKIIDVAELPTLSDATAGGVEPGSITFDLCRSFVDRFCLISEANIARSMSFIKEFHGQQIEGAAAVAVASLFNDDKKYQGKNIVVILCGGNCA